MAEVIAVVGDLGLPLLPRGAGTSLAGRAVGRGVVLDLSRHLTRISPLDPEAGSVEAEAGAVLAAVNSVAASQGLMYGPDPASADRATVGGAVGNNAAAHVKDRWPRTWRRASGYSLNYLTGFHPTRPPSWYAAPEAYPPDRGLNLASLLCGSEGTLAVTGRAHA